MNQALLTQEEYDKYSKIYKTYNPTRQDSNPPGTIVMGNSLTPYEIKVINQRIDAILKAGGLDKLIEQSKQ